MKYIEIVLNNGIVENLLDDNETNITNYTEELSKIFLSSNITILSFKDLNNTRIIVKPSEISLIRVNEKNEVNKNIEDEVITD